MTTFVQSQTPSRSDILHAYQQGQRLSQLNLQEIDLSGTNLIGVNLSQSNLSHANLENTDLRGANLQGCNLSNANLKNSYLFRSDLQGCNLENAQLEGARLQLARYDSKTIWPENYDYRNINAVGPKSNLNGAFLNTANLRYADLKGANLRGAYLSGADLTGANLENAALSGANLQRAILTGANLRNARLIGVELQGTDLRAVDFTDAILEQIASIAGADFTLAIGLSAETKSMLCSFSSQDLGTWNAYTRANTGQSLGRST